MKKLQKGTKNIENHRIFARPINVFSEEVYKDGEKVPRFQIIDEEE